MLNEVGVAYLDSPSKIGSSHSGRARSGFKLGPIVSTREAKTESERETWTTSRDSWKQSDSTLFSRPTAGDSESPLQPGAGDGAAREVENIVCSSALESLAGVEHSGISSKVPGREDESLRRSSEGGTASKREAWASLRDS